MNSVHSSSVSPRRGAPPRGQRLTRDAVIDQAEQLIVQDGLAAFSLRSLGDALGVRASGLYNHVQDREELLDAVVERFVQCLWLPPARTPWTSWVSEVAIALRAQLNEHSGLTELVLARAGATVAGPAVLAQFLEGLEAEGVERAVAHAAWHTMLTVVVGSLVPERARDSEDTFLAVLETVIDGMRTAASQPPSSRAAALLHSHDLG